MDDADFVYESERWTVNYRLSDDRGPWSGWLVAQPRRHVATWADLDHVELSEFGDVLRQVESALDAHFDMERMYVAAMGHKPLAHLHIHLVPATARQAKGPEVFDANLAERGPRPDLVESEPQARPEYFGIAAIAAQLTSFIRRYTPYRLAVWVHKKRTGGSRDDRRRGAIAERYTLLWLIVLALTLVATWHCPLCPLKCVAVVAVVVATLRLVDILATGTGIVLFDAQSRTYAGVASLQRSVILGLINLVELTLIGAIMVSAVELFASRSAFDPALQGVVDAIAAVASPIGVSGAVPVSDWAVVVSVISAASIAYELLLVVGVFVSNLTGALDRSS